MERLKVGTLLEAVLGPLDEHGRHKAAPWRIAA